MDHTQPLLQGQSSSSSSNSDRENLQNIQNGIRTLNKYTQKLNNLQQAFEKNPQDNSIQQKLIQIRKQATVAMQDVHQLILVSSQRMRDKSQIKQLSSSFNSALTQLKTVLNETSVTERSMVNQPYRSSSMSQDSDFPEPSQVQAFDQHQTDLLLDRKQELNALEADINQISGMYLDVASIVEASHQETMMIAEAAETASDHSETGVENMSAAERYANKVRKKKIFLGMCCITTIAVIVLIIVLTYLPKDNKQSGSNSNNATLFENFEFVPNTE